MPRTSKKQRLTKLALDRGLDVSELNTTAKLEAALEQSSVPVRAGEEREASTVDTAAREAVSPAPPPQHVAEANQKRRQQRARKPRRGEQRYLCLTNIVTKDKSYGVGDVATLSAEQAAPIMDNLRPM